MSDQVDPRDPVAHQDLEEIQVLQGHRDPKDLLDHQVHRDSQDHLDPLDLLVRWDQQVHEGIPDPAVIPDHEEIQVFKALLVLLEIKAILDRQELKDFLANLALLDHEEMLELLVHLDCVDLLEHQEPKVALDL